MTEEHILEFRVHPSTSCHRSDTLRGNPYPCVAETMRTSEHNDEAFGSRQSVMPSQVLPKRAERSSSIDPYGRSVPCAWRLPCSCSSALPQCSRRNRGRETLARSTRKVSRMASPPSPSPAAISRPTRSPPMPARSPTSSTRRARRGSRSSSTIPQPGGTGRSAASAARSRARATSRRSTRSSGACLARSTSAGSRRASSTSMRCNR